LGIHQNCTYLSFSPFVCLRLSSSYNFIFSSVLFHIAFISFYLSLFLLSYNFLCFFPLMHLIILVFRLLIKGFVSHDPCDLDYPEYDRRYNLRGNHHGSCVKSGKQKYVTFCFEIRLLSFSKKLWTFWRPYFRTGDRKSQQKKAEILAVCS
jgi:hypothetical protein